MSELETILGAWRALDQARTEAVLATVVHVTGSAYRRPGARMLLLPHGQRVGMLSGGCLEGEISRKAWWFTESPRPVVRVYDTTSGDDAVFEFGLGCNGVVHVMLERVQAPETFETLEFLEARSRARDTVVVATVVSADAHGQAEVGERLFVDEHGMRGGALRGSPLAPEVHLHARHAMASRSSHLAHVAGCAVFIECVAPPLDLVIFGAGDDAKPLVSIASELGWRVTVADGRPAFARQDRFPAAAQVVVLPRDTPLRDIAITTETSVVMMTHNYPLDGRLLPAILEHHPRYVGLLGPRHRADRLFEWLERDIPPNVHAPAGLDVGGESPAAVALSIVAEVQAAACGRLGTMLRLRDGAIHASVSEVGNALALPPGVAERPAYCETLVGHHAA